MEVRSRSITAAVQLGAEAQIATLGVDGRIAGHTNRPGDRQILAASQNLAAQVDLRTCQGNITADAAQCAKVEAVDVDSARPRAGQHQLPTGDLAGQLGLRQHQSGQSVDIASSV